jgi:hypothetical protein
MYSAEMNRIQFQIVQDLHLPSLLFVCICLQTLQLLRQTYNSIHLVRFMERLKELNIFNYTNLELELY